MYKLLNQLSNKKTMAIFAVFSLLIHLSVILTQVEYSKSDFKLSEEQSKVQQKILKLVMSSKKVQQVVETETSNNQKSENPRFLSNKDNHFDRETRSANVGSFKSAAKGQRKAVNNKNQQVAKSEKKKKSSRS